MQFTRNNIIRIIISLIILLRDFLCAMLSDLGLRCSILCARFSNYALKSSNLWKSLAGVHISWGTESVESNAEGAETCHIKKQKLLSPNGNLYVKRVNFISKNGNLHAKSGKWHIENAIIQNCPLPWELLRRVGILLPIYQIYLCGHSNRHQVMDQKSSFFICPRVSARFLHCFCTVSRDAMGTLTCKIRQRVQKLPGRKSRCFAQKWRKLETSKIRVFCPVGSFNQRARDSSSLERTKIPRRNGIARACWIPQTAML